MTCSVCGRVITPGSCQCQLQKYPGTAGNVRLDDKLGTPKSNEWRHQSVGGMTTGRISNPGVNNPCNHSGFESYVCEICGYPHPDKMIAALKERLEDHHRAILGRDAKINELEAELKRQYNESIEITHDQQIKLEKYQSFWEYSRLADKQQWETYHWNKESK